MDVVNIKLFKTSFKFPNAMNKKNPLKARPARKEPGDEFLIHKRLFNDR